ncbi:MAG: hypothetical protein LBS19_07075 [Clostridiales bacterium]|jgi:Na+/alanine symporter|nr:hypothetical protein [Clostridiales bacterium]
MDKKYMSDNKRVILITGDEQKWFEQAIFIVRKSAAQRANIDFVREAELIIQNYMSGAAARTPVSPEPGLSAAPSGRAAASVRKTYKSHRSKLDVIINTMIIVVCGAIVVMLARIITG